MKLPLWILTSSLICFTAFKTGIFADSAEHEGNNTAIDSQVTPSTESKQAAPIADAQPLTPSTESKQVAPIADVQPLTPSTESKQAAPLADAQPLTPSTESKQAAPLADAQPSTPSTESKQAAPIADAQQKVPSQRMTPSNPKDAPKMSCMKANNPHRIEVKHIESKGVGYNQGYTSLDGFFTSMLNNFIPFLDVRAHVFNNGKWAANAGIGSRYIFDSCQWMVGANVYYDYRSTNHANFNQIGAGAEAFFDRYEFHLNGYLPVGQKSKLTKKNLESIEFEGFTGHYILQTENYTNTYEGAMKGFNGELGAHLAGNRKQYDVYFGIGPYYYDHSSGRHAWGGKARLKAELTKYLFLEVSDSYDHIFHNRVQGSVNVSIPFGGKHCYPKKSEQSCSNVMDWQAMLPVERQEIIVVSKFKKSQTIDPVAIDPTTGKPFYVIFVNNTNNVFGNLGNGTFENPYANLTATDNAISAENAATDGNTIYVFAGDGSSTGMIGGNMFLNPYNRLLGSGNSHTFQTTMGLLTVPALTTSMPNVQGPNSANIINLANSCEVSGLNISFVTFTSPSNNVACISGRPASGNLTNTNINNNILTNGSFGVVLGQVSSSNLATGNLIITNNTAVNQTSASSSVIGLGYSVQSSQNATITLANNVARDSGSTAAGLLVVTYGGDVVTISNNLLEDLGAPTATALLIAGGITCVDNGTTAQSNRFTITGNTVNDTAAASGSFYTTNPNNLTTFIIEDNAFINAQIGQTNIRTQPGSTACVRFNGNKGYPYQGNTPVFNFTAGTGTINLETPMNNFPQPGTSGVTLKPACFCGQPCD